MFEAACGTSRADRLALAAGALSWVAIFAARLERHICVRVLVTVLALRHAFLVAVLAGDAGKADGLARLVLVLA